MKNFSIILSTVAIVLAVVAIVLVSKKAPVASAPAAAVSQADLASALTSNPKIVVDALQAYEQQQREAQEKAAAELLQKYAGEISSDANVPFVGPKDAKVVVTEFFDFSCGFCKRLAPEIEKLMADNADVKFVFKPLTFVSPTSPYQAKAGFAVFNQGQDKFQTFYKAVMGGNAGSEALVDELAQQAGVDMEKYKADVASADIAKHIEDVASFAQKIQVNGVPAVFINGKKVEGRTAGELQSDINSAKK